MKLDNKYKIPLTGKPNKAVFMCPDCGIDLNEFEKYRGTIDYAVGFAEDRNLGTVAIIECPNCFKKWYFHVYPTDIYGHYAMFLDSVKEGMQKHFKPK